MPAVAVAHRNVDVDGIHTFYRVAGPADAAVVLLPHGYPSSSFQFRNLMPALGDRWRLLAPDLPGFGYTRAAAGRFAYTFDAYADFLRRFTDVLGLTRYAIYLQDYGSQYGLRLAMSAPERVAALIVQNGDIYEDPSATLTHVKACGRQESAGLPLRFPAICRTVPSPCTGPSVRGRINVRILRETPPTSSLGLSPTIKAWLPGMSSSSSARA